MSKYQYGVFNGPYEQKSIKKRIEALLIDNVSKIVTREMLVKASVNPITGREPENWHQRLSELRTDDGYSILTSRDSVELNVSEYVLESLEKRKTAGKRVIPDKTTWILILNNANNVCEWRDDGQICGMKSGDIDPIGGGTVKLTPDHKQPHSVNPAADSTDPTQWQALCGRHQVMKKNYWDSSTGKFNVIAILQSLSHKDKVRALGFLNQYFKGETL